MENVEELLKNKIKERVYRGFGANDKEFIKVFVSAYNSTISCECNHIYDVSDGEELSVFVGEGSWRGITLEDISKIYTDYISQDKLPYFQFDDENKYVQINNKLDDIINSFCVNNANFIKLLSAC